MKKLFLEDIWNEAIDAAQSQREVKPRQHIWSSEIGKSFYDRYLKMTGVQPTEVKESRVLRKFAAGIIFEELVGKMLGQIGFLKSSQEYITIPATDKTLEVTGKIDYIAGMEDWTEAKQRIEEFHQTNDTGSLTISQKIAINLVEKLSQQYPEGFENTPLEIKSVNSMLFWAKKDYLDEAYPFHIFQLFTYLKAKQLPEGRIDYISKDDMTIKEITVKLSDKEIEEKWQKDVETMTHYIKNSQKPPKPDFVIFDPRGKVKFQRKKVKYETKGEWKANWEIKWSDYFRLITGTRNVEEWERSLKSEIKKRNDELKEEFIKDNNI